MTVTASSSTNRPTPTLTGRHVTLVPLAREHVPGLRAVLADPGLGDLWFTNTPTVETVDDYVDKALAVAQSGTVFPFAVLDSDGNVVGSTRLYGYEPEVPKILIGYTWYAPRVQRTAVNTEAKLLLLHHAFDTLGCIGVAFETSAHNQRSRAAIARLGAKQDGILRHHKRHADGSPRDTVYFSIINGEWPQIERDLSAKLAQRGTKS